MRQPPEFAAAADLIARSLLGDPDQETTAKDGSTELRWGGRGAFKVTVDGPKAGLFYDNETGSGGNLLKLITERNSCDEIEAIAWAKSLGVDIQSKHPIAAYVYTAADGTPLFRVLRWGPRKGFSQESWDEVTGGYIRGLNGASSVPYRLPSLLASSGALLITEGEKAAEALVNAGLEATCSPGGAGKWPPTIFQTYFKGRDVILFPDRDEAGAAHARAIAADLLPAAASVRVLELPNLAPKGDPYDWLEAGGSAEQLLELIKAAPNAKAWLAAHPDPKTSKSAAPNSTAPYFHKAGGLWRRVGTAQGVIELPLTNFTATIVCDLVRDDGAETARSFEIEATLHGRPSRFAVAATEFATMTWATKELGGRALVHPGAGTKDHTRFAVQWLSSAYQTRHVYTHVGWRECDGQPVYLHAGGALDPDGLRTDIECDPGELGRFMLPAPGDPKASLQLLELARLEATAPLLALIYRAPLGPSDITMHLAGPTGVFKSELAALAQQHWAPTMDARHLIGWHSTANSLEAAAFVAKDALLVVDDYAPQGTQSDVARMQREAARLIRAQGNRAGRGRLRPDGTMRPTKPPRCTLLSTGEDTPGGQSIRARMMVLEVDHGDIDQTSTYAAAGPGAERCSRGRAQRLHHPARGRSRRLPGLVPPPGGRAPDDGRGGPSSDRLDGR